MDHLHRMLQALDVPKPRRVRCLKAVGNVITEIPENLPKYQSYCFYRFPDKDHYIILIKVGGVGEEWLVRDDLEHVDQLGPEERGAFLSPDVLIADAPDLKYPGLPLEKFLEYWGPSDEYEDEDEDEDYD